VIHTCRTWAVAAAGISKTFLVFLIKQLPHLTHPPPTLPNILKISYSDYYLNSLLRESWEDNKGGKHLLLKSTCANCHNIIHKHIRFLNFCSFWLFWMRISFSSLLFFLSFPNYLLINTTVFSLCLYALIDT